MRSRNILLLFSLHLPIFLKCIRDRAERQITAESVFVGPCVYAVSCLLAFNPLSFKLITIYPGVASKFLVWFIRCNIHPFPVFLVAFPAAFVPIAV